MDVVWLVCDLLDRRAGTELALGVVKVMGSNTSIGTDLIDPAFARMSLAEVCTLASRL